MHNPDTQRSLRLRSTGQPVTIDADRPLGTGGEATVYAVSGDSQLAAKLWYHPGPDKTGKLDAMLGVRELEIVADVSHVPVAWPRDGLIDDGGNVVGFVMPRIHGGHPPMMLWSPGDRKRTSPLFSWLYLHRSARNLAAAVKQLHAAGIVIGDVNEMNVLVTERALVTLVDADSFQLRDASNRLFTCPVAKPDYTPPELLARTDDYSERTDLHDRFGLGVLVFRLLMEGTHPFAGRYPGADDPPDIPTRIETGHFPHAGRTLPIEPLPVAPAFGNLHPDLQALFIACFDEGHDDPERRPDAATWHTALEAVEAGLATCAANGQHRYSPHLESCPWCERTALFGGKDPFPSRVDVRAGRHLPPPAVASSRQPVVKPARPAQPSARPGPVPRHQPQKTSPRSAVGWTILLIVELLISFIALTHGCGPGNSQDSSSRLAGRQQHVYGGYSHEYRQRPAQREQAAVRLQRDAMANRGPTRLVWLPDAHCAAATDGRRDVKLWRMDVRGHLMLAGGVAGNSAVRALGARSDRYALVVYASGEVAVLAPIGNRSGSANTWLDTPIRAAAWSDDGAFLVAATDERPPQLAIWSVSLERRTDGVDDGHRVPAVTVRRIPLRQVLPDSRQLVMLGGVVLAGGEREPDALLDVPEDVAARLAHHRHGAGVALLRARGDVLATVGSDHTMLVTDANGSAEALDWAIAPPLAIAIGTTSGGHKRVAVVDLNGWVGVMELVPGGGRSGLDTGKLPHGFRPLDIAFCESATALLVSSADGGAPIRLPVSGPSLEKADE